MKPIGFDGDWYKMPCKPVRVINPPSSIYAGTEVILRDAGEGIVLRDKVGNLDLIDGNIVLADHPAGVRLRYGHERYKFMVGLIGAGIGWIRIFGYGIRWKDLRRHSLVFSEREGYTVHFEIGHWSFAALAPERAWRQCPYSNKELDTLSGTKPKGAK